MTRTQFPLVAGFAITVSKAQGLTIKEGVVIHLVGGKRFRPAAKHGLPFVAWTRSESFHMTAFKNLPPWMDFVNGRESVMLRARQAFDSKLQRLHRSTLARYSNMQTSEDEFDRFTEWKDEQARRPKRFKKDKPAFSSEMLTTIISLLIPFLLPTANPKERDSNNTKQLSITQVSQASATKS